MAKNKLQDPEIEEQDAREEVALVGYELLEPRTENVAHGGVIYSVYNGRIDCPLEIALELRSAGVLK